MRVCEATALEPLPLDAAHGARCWLHHAYCTERPEGVHYSTAATSAEDAG